MKYFSRILIMIVTLSVIITACSKVDNLSKQDPLPLYLTGISPVLSSTVTTVAPALADSSNSVIGFSWTNPKYANDSATTKYVLEIDSAGGSFSNPASFTVKGNLSRTITGRELNAMLIGFGYPLNASKEIDVRVISSYANNNDRYVSNVLKINAAPFSDGSVLTASATSIETALATSGDNIINFNWNRPFPGYGGVVNYTLQYDSSGKNFATSREIAIDPSTAAAITLKQGQMNETALNVGIIGGTTGEVAYRIKAVTALGVIVYSNTWLVTIKTYFPIRRFYLPGAYQSSTGNGEDWNPPTAPEFIRDQRAGLVNDMYYMYIYMPANQEFRITQGRSWDISIGGTGGNLSIGGNNFTVPVSGYYRISINATTLKYDIREGRMGFVGGATGAGWTPPNVFPTYAMGAAGTNLFVGITNLASGEWKMIDNNEWNNGSNTVNETRSYGTKSASGSALQTNGDNFDNTNAAGRYRAIWDGRDRDNVKYEISPATEMRVVGNGIQGVADWTPGVSPQMSYLGNGIWSISISLLADKEIKFLAGNDWGAFDYEDNSGGSNAVGAEKKIRWDGNANFKTPATAGTYTIILNENDQTVSINN